MKNRRFAQVSTSDEEDEVPIHPKRSLTEDNKSQERKRKKMKLQEEGDGEDEERELKNKKKQRKKKDEKEKEEEEEEEGVQEDTKPIGEAVREDPVLLVPEDKEQKPYIAIIKDISQTKDESIMVTGQWFYRPEEAERKGGRSWQSRDTRKLFYSFPPR
ncbi:hypothetical protein PTKIN_Ptkin04bG0188900 [Pterospermum kingtungense]